MKLVKDWKKVAKSSWSLRCHAGSAVLYSAIAGALMFWPALQDRVSLSVFGIGAVLLNVAGGLLRLVDQKLDDE